MLSPAELDHLRIVLVATRNPLNIGAAARAMSNFGILRLRVVNPYEAAFREARSAVGASPVLAAAEEYSSVAEAVADCSLVVGTTAARDRELHHPLHRLEAGGDLIRDHLASAPVAILFGSEKRGLANEDLSHCHWLMRIPTRAEHGSMNLGQAVAVSLYELARGENAMPQLSGAAQRKNAAQQRNKDNNASAGELERITETLLQALRASEYLKPRAGAATEEKIRRLVRRMDLSADDAEVWLGMLRQMVWKMKAE